MLRLEMEVNNCSCKVKAAPVFFCENKSSFRFTLWMRKNIQAAMVNSQKLLQCIYTCLSFIRKVEWRGLCNKALNHIIKSSAYLWKCKLQHIYQQRYITVKLGRKGRSVMVSLNSACNSDIKVFTVRHAKKKTHQGQWREEHESWYVT